MQMVKKIFIALAVFWFALFVFMPKQALYYKLEQELAKYNIKINEKSIQEGWFTLNLQGLDVYVKGIKLASIEEVKLFTLLFYSKVELDNLMLDESLKAMAPTQTEHAKLTHAIWSAPVIHVEAEGSFAGLEGDIYLLEKRLRLDFNDTKAIADLQPKLKKDKKGWYYETSF